MEGGREKVNGNTSNPNNILPHFCPGASGSCESHTFSHVSVLLYNFSSRSRARSVLCVVRCVRKKRDAPPKSAGARTTTAIEMPLGASR